MIKYLTFKLSEFACEKLVNHKLLVYIIVKSHIASFYELNL